MVSISTENTLAPSFARSAASGRPTTSDLCDALGDVLYISEPYRLITVTVFPYARSPYVRILLYTPTCSRHLTTPRGVQGMMDLTVPGGGVSSITDWMTFVDGRVDVREAGVMKRMLYQVRDETEKHDSSATYLW